ncbi:hypothetical protein D3C78_1479020 [compost metagenome]
MLQVFRHDNTHGITETNFCQQIVQCSELHTLKFTLDILRRDLGKLTAATQRMVEQTATQADGVITLEVFQQLANFGACLGAHDKIQPRRVWTCTRCGNDFYRLAAGERL